MKGWLVIGGGNLEASEKEIHTTLIEKAGGSKAVLCIIPTASGENPVETIKHVRNLWMELGLQEKQIKVLPVYGGSKMNSSLEDHCAGGAEANTSLEDHCAGGAKANTSLEDHCAGGAEANTSLEDHCAEKIKKDDNPISKDARPPQGDDPQIAEMLQDVTGCWFTGGDQYYTHQAFLRQDGEDTLALVKMREILSAGGVLGGTSAGAAIMSRQMICAGNNKGALERPVEKGYEGYDEESDEDALRLAKGLGFLEEGVVDQHFDQRCRTLRLIRSLAESKEEVSLGYGVSEDTAMIVDRQQQRIEVQGSGGVYIVDAREAIHHWKKEKFSCQGIRLHVLQEGDSFALNTKKVQFGKS